MNSRKHFSPHGGQPARRGFAVHPKAFIFFDKLTGTQRFEVAANDDGSMPSDYAASLLAVQCLIRGKMPGDFNVMVIAGENLLDSLDHQALKLIEACQGVQLSAASLTGRQKEVLRGILQTLSNKEIAVKLNVTERTVKFHVSCLLLKFEVTGRVALMRKVADLLSAGKISIGFEAPQFAPGEERGAVPSLSRKDHVHLVPLKKVSRG